MLRCIRESINAPVPDNAGDDMEDFALHRHMRSFGSRR